MKTYSEIMKYAEHKKLTESAWEDIDKRTQAFVEDVEKSYPDKATAFLKDLKNLVCYPPITEPEAVKYVSEMENKDGSHGGHWSVARVKEMACKHPEVKAFSFSDFYVALNMMYSDFYAPAKTEEDYIREAVDFLDDKDAPKNKMRRYMVAMEE